MRQNDSTIDHARQGGLVPLLAGDERSPGYLDQALLLSAENVGKNQIARHNREGYIILQAVNRLAQKVVNIRSEAREAYQRYRAIKTPNRGQCLGLK